MISSQKTLETKTEERTRKRETRRKKQTRKAPTIHPAEGLGSTSLQGDEGARGKAVTISRIKPKIHQMVQTPPPDRRPEDDIPRRWMREPMMQVSERYPKIETKESLDFVRRRSQRHLHSSHKLAANWNHPVKLFASPNGSIWLENISR